MQLRIIILKLVRTPLNVLLLGHFLKYLSLSLYAPITSDECHAWFHLNAASPAERNTEQVTITKNLVYGRIRTLRLHGLQITSQAASPLGHSNVTSEGIKLNVMRVNKYILVHGSHLKQKEFVGTKSLGITPS